MDEKTRERRSIATRACAIAAAVLLAASLVLRQLFAHGRSSFFPAYRDFSRAWIYLLAHLMSVAPFALWDILALALIIAAIAVLVRCIRRRRGFALWAAVVALAVSWTYFSFTAGWALNHYAPPLSREIGLEIRESSVDELEDATRYYLEQAARLAPQVPRDADGVPAALVEISPRCVVDDADAADYFKANPVADPILPGQSRAFGI